MSLYAYVADGDGAAEDFSIEDMLHDLQITHGNPTAEELAIVAALVSASGRVAPAYVVHPSERSAWGDPARRLRRPLPTGGWRSSARR